MTANNVDKETLERAIAENETVCIDFWATWCGPCRKFGPIFEQVSDEYENVYFAKADVDENPELAEELSIQSVPTLIIVRNREIAFRQSGAVSAQALREIIDKTINADKTIEG